MNFGQLLLILAAAAALAAALLFALGLAGRRVPHAAGWLYGLHALALVGAMGLLAYDFLAHRFQFEYVWEFSSRALSPALTLAASWAGQEGSILLWAALGALLGLALLRQPGTLSRPAMFFVCLAQLFLLTLLLVRSPFRVTFPVPADGQGLNPLLEDPWMVAHPPVLFLGYATLGIPFALAGAALARQDYKSWNRMVWPWALLGVLTLGLGIGMGGVWAYKVLGWGGYWGWDPVENASLVPWLVAVALLHGLFIQRSTGAVIRTNLLLALLGWVTVLGGTYLTRSGVLQDFSVHSFSDSGLNVPLLSFLAGGALLSAALLAIRWRSIRAFVANWLAVSRESALWLGMATVLVLAAFVALGTSAPLLTRLAGTPSGVKTSFYEAVSLPLGILLTLLMALAPALRWSRQERRSWIGALGPGLAGAVVALVVCWAAGMHAASRLVLAAAAAMALGVNAWTAARLFRRGWNFGAANLGHLGVAVMVLGMVVSATFGRSERARLVQNTPTQVMGYTLTYLGGEPGRPAETRLRIRVEQGGFRFDARPSLMLASRGEGVMRKPAIRSSRDLYLSPLEVQAPEAAPAAGAEVTRLVQGQPVTVAGVTYTFRGFRMTSHGQVMEVFADIQAQRGGRTYTVSPGVQQTGAGRQPRDAQLPGGGTVSLAGMRVEEKSISVALPGAAAPPPAGGVALVELSTKPLISLVWVGAVLALVGSALAALRRAGEQGTRRAAAGAVVAAP
ncbi:MAG TPA: cytochrome c biogenesis protein CcsA [Candidatus Saccharimonadales bacterium]|nr:cytochrome c biogenesis protein CcsA [Candidatus Saccharimonadales bacterium]